MRFASLAFAFLLFAFLPGCGNENYPVAPVTTGFTVSGRILPASLLEKGRIAGGITIRLTGPSGERTTQSDSLGNYSFPEVKPGAYTLAAEKEGLTVAPEVRTVAVERADAAAECFFWVKDEDAGKSSFICGRVTAMGNGTSPRIAFYCRAKSDNTFQGAVSVDSTGVCRSYPFEKGKTYILTANVIGFEYAVSPDSLEVIADTPIIIRNFSLERTSASMHQVSGRVLNSKGEPVFVGLALRIRNGKGIQGAYTDSLGCYSIPAPDGDYTLTVMSSSYQFSPETIPVSVKGDDIVLPDLTGTWIGYTYYTIYGRVIDRHGNGISGVKIAGYNVKNRYTSASAETVGPDGAFSLSISVQGKEEKYGIHPSLTGYAFAPDSLGLTVTPVEDVTTSDPITLPDFIGLNYTVYTDADYFPLRTGASWTYIRTMDSNSSSEFTTRITGTAITAGYGYYRFSNPGISGRMDFRIDGETVRTVLSGKDTEFLRFGVLPGRKWVIGDTSGDFVTTGELLWVDTVTVPAGTYADCLKYEICTTYGQTSYDKYTLWLAKGVGVVKSVKTLVNYGETREMVTDELKSYTP